MPQVQVINRGQSTAGLAGQAFGQGLSNVSTAMVNQKLNEMLETKQIARQYDQNYKQGVAISKFEPDKNKRQAIIEAVTVLGQDGYMKLHEHFGTANIENLISGGFGANQPPPSESTQPPPARQMGTQAYDYTPEGLMSSGGQGMGQNQPAQLQQQRAPTIQQQEMLNAQQTQAANTQLMANNVAPNIQGIPQSQRQQQAGPQPQAGSQEQQAKDWLRDSSDQEFNQALQGVPQGQKQGYRNYRLQLQKEKREAGAQAENLALKKESLGVTKERLELEKQKASFDQTRKTRSDLTKENSKFLDESAKSSTAASSVLKSLDKMEQIRKKGNLGIMSSGKIFDAETRKDKGIYDSEASNILNLYRALFPRGITTPEFKRISEHWLPSSNFTDATNEGREEVFRRMTDLVVQENDLLLSLQKPDGSYPANVQAIVHKQFRDQEKALKKDLLEGPGLSVGDVTEKLESASKFPVGYRVEELDKDNNPTGYIYISDQKNWKKVKK